MKLLVTSVTRKQCVEFGQVSVLGPLLAVLYFKDGHALILAALVLILLTIVMPMVFYPFAVVWFGLAKFLAGVVPPVVLGILFFVMVTPLGLVRRMLGRDALRLRQFKKGSSSVMNNRDHVYTEADLKDTF
jgi:membrane protein implicated in regulation of membrane protease activity